MRYLPKSDAERAAMLREIGASSIDDLFAIIPEEYRLTRDLAIPRQMGESEIVDHFKAAAAKNANGYASFLGAGVYRHYRPVLIDAIVQRGEFLTSYTPYQAEITQGTLQAIFEFQTMICELTGMDIANASMYDGSTAAPEAAMMAMRVTGRDGVVVARSVHPEYREVMRTYAQHREASSGHATQEIGYGPEGTSDAGRIDLAALDTAVDEQTACVLVQSPNFFGVIEDIPAIAEIAQKKGALLVVAIAEAVSLGIVRPPVEADVVIMEAQSFGVAPSYGGPFCGRDRGQREICSADAGAAGGRDQGLAGTARVRADSLDARAAHPAREGDLEHLYEPGAGRADGDGVHDGLRQRGNQRAGAAESGEGGLRGEGTGRQAELLFSGDRRGSTNLFCRREESPD